MPSSLHLSLLRLPRNDPRWRHLDAYQAHQLVWTAFPGVPREPGARPFLFDLSRRSTPGGDVYSLLVQSTVAPDWRALGDGADVQTKTFAADAAAVGARLAFSLRANPTVFRHGFADGKGRRVGVGINPEMTFAQRGRPGEHPTSPADVAAWREVELAAWLRRQGERGGFAVEAVAAGPVVERRIVRPRDRGGAPMTLHEVEFAGVLSVTDAAAFAATRSAGVGRGRSFGFGLLMLRPA